jgi:hypothetical protein
MEKMKRILFEELDYQIQGADIYNTKTSKWLIFTDSKKWVLEYTNTNTLWFNYTFFKNTLIFFGMDCADADSKNMIKEWFESRFLGIEVEDTLKNGVKHTYKKKITRLNEVEDTIQNGVKDTMAGGESNAFTVEDTIQNGVKDTLPVLICMVGSVEDTIQNGVKETRTFNSPPINSIEDTIQNGVKESYPYYFEGGINVEDTIQNGVKEISAWVFPRSREIKNAIEFGGQQPPNVDKTIKNGVKDIGHFDMDDNIIAEDVIENEVKHTDYHWHIIDEKEIEDTIQNGVKDTIGTLRRTKLGVKKVKERLVESLEQKDHMVTSSIITEDINYAIENGVKE